MNRFEKIKTFPQWFFLMLHPIFPPIRNFFMRIGIVRHTPYRQPFLIGKLKDHVSKHHFVIHMQELGYHLMVVAWDDPGQVCSMRKIDPLKHDYQYHIRVFDDHTVNGHHEKTPEDHPYDHLEEIGFSEAKEEFLKDLEGLLE